jgi:hypothetical protein
MAASAVYSGSISLTAQLQAILGTDLSGSQVGKFLRSLSFSASGGAAPTLTGFVHAAAVVCAAGDWLLADASDPFQSMGDAQYSQGFAPAGAKPKLITVANLDTVNTITVKRGAANGLTLFDTAGAGQVIQPGGFLFFYDPTGATCGALTTGSNDKLTIAVSGGSPNAEVLIGYGP